jgi:hypothetical protein
MDVFWHMIYQLFLHSNYLTMSHGFIVSHPYISTHNEKRLTVSCLLQLHRFNIFKNHKYQVFKKLSNKHVMCPHYRPLYTSYKPFIEPKKRENERRAYEDGQFYFTCNWTQKLAGIRSSCISFRVSYHSNKKWCPLVKSKLVSSWWATLTLNLVLGVTIVKHICIWKVSKAILWIILFQVSTIIRYYKIVLPTNT